MYLLYVTVYQKLIILLDYIMLGKSISTLLFK